MRKELTRYTANKVLGGVVSGLQRAYLPQMDLKLLRVLVAVATFFVHPLTPLAITAYLVLWAVLPTEEGRQLQA